MPWVRKEARHVYEALAAGVRLTLLSPARPAAFDATPASFLIIIVLGLLVSFGLSYFAVEPPRAFSYWGIQSEGFYILVALGMCFLMASTETNRHLTLPLATLIFSAGLLAGSVMTLFQDHVLPQLTDAGQRIHWMAWAWFVLWWLAIWHRALSMLELGRPAQRRVMACAAVAVLAALPFFVDPMRLWDRDYTALYEQEEEQEGTPLIGEEIFANQPRLLDRALAQIAPGLPGQPDLYFVAFGPYGDQDVFLKESLYSSRLFEARFGAQGRTLTLVNNRQKLDELPLATVTNLDQSLKAIASRMNPAEDILFLFLTSHGSRDASLSIELANLSFKPLTAPALATVLKGSGIRWKVVVVSGCYSGTFLDALKADDTMVISAARADRTSFGCSDGAEFTYFGRAFFQQALNRTHSFAEAFGIASKLVAEWETREGRTRSEPQMVAGKLIEAQLEHWRATLPGSP
ncbi:MAG: C13 family peptidase [Arenimonas sp.]